MGRWEPASFRWRLDKLVTEGRINPLTNEYRLLEDMVEEFDFLCEEGLINAKALGELPKILKNGGQPHGN